MSNCEGLGECCGADRNIYAWFQHHFYRHRPLVIYEIHEEFGMPVILPTPPNPGQMASHEAEACQDGYLTLTKVTTYVHSVNGALVRTQVWDNNPFTGAIEPTDTHPTAYPVDANGWPIGWDFDSDYVGSVVGLDGDPSTGTHFRIIWRLMSLTDNAVKLTLTVDITLSGSATYAGFINRCRDLYAVPFERMVSDSAGAVGGDGWVGLWYEFNDSGDIVDTPYGVQIFWDAYWSVESTYFSGLKSIRLPGVIIYESGMTVIDARIANPIIAGNDYKLTERVCTASCEGWSPQNPCSNYPLLTCGDLGQAGIFEVEAPEFGQSLVEPGTC